jgi:nitronate monooxygenase
MNPVRARLAQMRLPLIGAPMFLVSNPQLVLAQCRAGICGVFPSLNARTPEILEQWLDQIQSTIDQEKIAAPFGVNLICHPTNQRLEQDLRSCVDRQVPLIVTSLHPPAEIIQAVHHYGGLVLHDVINARHAEKAAAQGVDGLILVAAGAGGHSGTLNPFAFVEEVRSWYDGIVVLAGGISTGRSLAAALVAGADFGYMGTRFIATEEANAAPEYKDMLVKGTAKDILYSDYFTGVKGNYLKPSIEVAGLDPENMPTSDGGDLGVLQGDKKAWRDIWSAGQGIGAIQNILPVAALVEQLEQEFLAAQ